MYHTDNTDFIGRESDFINYYCCTTELAANGACDSPGSLILQHPVGTNLSKWHYHQTDVHHSQDTVVIENVF